MTARLLIVVAALASASGMAWASEIEDVVVAARRVELPAVAARIVRKAKLAEREIVRHEVLEAVSKHRPASFANVKAALRVEEPAANRPTVTPGNVNGNRPEVPPGLADKYGSP